MPAFVKDEKAWKKARRIANTKNLEGENYWKYVTSIYKRMRPEDFAKEAKHIIKGYKNGD